MKHALVRSLFVGLLVLSTLGPIIYLPTVHAGSTIRILPDGSVDPPTAPLIREGSIYYFASDIYDSISVECPHVVIDGRGFKLQGTGVGGGFSILLTAPGVLIRNTVVTGFSHGIDVYGSLSVLKNNTLTGNSVGISMQYTMGVTITENTITENSGGIDRLDSNGDTVSNNTIANNGYALWGIYSNSGNLIDNIIANNSIGIKESSSSTNISGNRISNSPDKGILLDDPSITTVSRNILENNNLGLHITGYMQLSDIQITNNVFAYNNIGLEINADAVNNRFYHNNFINNVQQVNYPYPQFNYWDDGYPSGGNFWSNYAGIDLYNGPSQNLSGSDGIGDTPYVVALNNADRYPFMVPFNTTDFFALRITAEIGGTTSPTLGLHVYNAGATVDVTATPESDYLFDHWELDNLNAGTANPISVSMNTNHILDAIFRSKPDIAVTSVSPHPTSILRGELVYIDVTVENQRYTTETFDVVVYADRDRSVIGDEVMVGIVTVYDLLPGDTTKISFVWNTATAPSSSTYCLSAKAIVPYDIDPSDNLLTAKKKVTVRR